MNSWLDGLVKCNCAECGGCGNTLSISKFGGKRYYNACRMDRGKIEQLCIRPDEVESIVLEFLLSRSDELSHEKWELLTDIERNKMAKSIIKSVLLFDTDYKHKARGLIQIMFPNKSTARIELN